MSELQQGIRARAARAGGGVRRLVALCSVVWGPGCWGLADNTTLQAQSDWLGSCASDSDCIQGQCLCGVCTQPCDTGSCEGGPPGAVCADLAHWAHDAFCAGRSEASICISQCVADADAGVHAECGAGQACVADLCLPEPAAALVQSGVAGPLVGSLCATDPVVSRSLLISNQAQLDALRGCERIHGDLELVVFPGIDETPLLSLRAVTGMLWLHPPADEAISGELRPLDGFRALTQAGGIKLSWLTLTTLEPLGRLQRIVEPDAAIPRPDGTGELPPRDGPGVLSIESCPGLGSLEGLDVLEQVAHVRLSANPSLTSIAGMSLARQVQSLAISDCPLTDLVGAEGLGLRSLTISNSTLANLSGLGNAPALQRLILLANPALISLEGLGAPPIMEEVLLEQNTALTSVRGLEGLREVERFSVVEDRESSSLGALSGLDKLEQVGRLLLQGTSALPNLTGLGALRRAADLEISYSDSLQDLSGLTQLEEVGALYLIVTPRLVRLTGLGRATIADLFISDASIVDLQGLEEVTIGDSLHITTSDLRTLEGLPRLSATNELTVSDCPGLNDLAALRPIASLRELDLSKTGLSHLDDLVNLRQLRRLSLAGNYNLVQIDGLSGVAGLVGMTIRQNDQLRSLPVFSVLSDCVECDGFHLELLDNAALELGPGLPGLETAGGISVMNNPVLSRLDGLSTVRSLSRLEVVNNALLTGLDLSSLSQVGAIVIRGNTALDDAPLISLASALVPPPAIKIVSNQSGRARLDPCPWTRDAICDETLGDCRGGSDFEDCRYAPPLESEQTSAEAQP
jgi:Leucine-rich repeat (LRR) protein